MATKVDDEIGSDVVLLLYSDPDEVCCEITFREAKVLRFDRTNLDGCVCTSNSLKDEVRDILDPRRLGSVVWCFETYPCFAIFKFCRNVEGLFPIFIFVSGFN